MENEGLLSHGTKKGKPRYDNWFCFLYKTGLSRVYVQNCDNYAEMKLSCNSQNLKVGQCLEV